MNSKKLAAWILPALLTASFAIVPDAHGAAKKKAAKSSDTTATSTDNDKDKDKDKGKGHKGGKKGHKGGKKGKKGQGSSGTTPPPK